MSNLDLSKPLVLIGMSGCGKSTYAKQMAETLKCEAVDLDSYIEEYEGMAISEIFTVHGEAYFRELEWTLFNELLRANAKVIATGAGLVPSAIASGRMKPEQAFFCFINPSLDKIVKNLSKPEEQAKRPLFNNIEDLYAAVEKQAKLRMDSYLAWADEVITTF